MKNKNMIAEEEDSDEEVKKNTDKNIQIGKDALNEESESGTSSSHSDNEEDNENEDKKENDKKKENENEEKKENEEK